MYDCWLKAYHFHLWALTLCLVNVAQGFYLFNQIIRVPLTHPQKHGRLPLQHLWKTPHTNTHSVRAVYDQDKTINHLAYHQDNKVNVMLISAQKITWNAAVHQRLLGFIELSLNTAQAIKWCPTNEQRAISHSAGPCETARVLDGGLGCTLNSMWQWAASPVPCWILMGRYFSMEERLWQGSVRPARLHHPLEPIGRCLSHAIF